MENINPHDAGLMVTCEHCQAQNAPGKIFCTQCRYPIGGTEDQKGRFQSEIAKNQILLKDAEEKIQSARNIIFVVAGLSLLAGLILYFSQDDLVSLIVQIMVCILYLGLAAWCTSNPFGAILTAFIVYLTLHLVAAVVDPITIVQGIILKVIFIGAFIKGIRSASEARTYMRELEKSKVEPVGTYY